MGYDKYLSKEEREEIKENLTKEINEAESLKSSIRCARNHFQKTYTNDDYNNTAKSLKCILDICMNDMSRIVQQYKNQRLWNT